MNIHTFSPRYVIVGLAVFLLAACEVKRPDYVLTDEQMEQVLYDFHIAKAIGDDLPYNESYKRVLYIESVYEKHGIDQARFDSSMAWYAHNTEAMVKVYEKVNKRLKTDCDAVNHLIALRSNKQQGVISGDSVDLWAWEARQRLSGMPLDNRVQFSLNIDTTFYDSDRLEWTADFRYPHGKPLADHAPVMSLQMEYGSDTIVSRMHHITTEGRQTLRLGADSLGALKSVRGFIYYPQPTGKQVLAIEQIKLMRYHQHKP